MKKAVTIFFSMGLILASTMPVFAAGNAGANDEFNNAIAQVVVEENRIEENGHITEEYVWKDKPMMLLPTYATEDEQLGYASWVKTTGLSAGTLKHRAAKISPNAGSSAWYACSQTDYAAWHYSRARIVKTLTGKILEDSNQVQVDSGVATARTPKDSLYLLDWDYSLRSYWGT